jgi:hypothetical protein
MEFHCLRVSDATRKLRIKHMRVPLIRFFAAALFLMIAAGTQAQFVAYFDHSRGAGTHANTLSFLVHTPASSGYLTNAADGVTTPVVLIATTNGAMSVGTGSAEPAAGTPAYATFNGFVRFDDSPGSALQVGLNESVTYTFSNLNPNATYIFKGTAVRGGTGSNYTNRWTRISIVGADSFTANHTANAVTSAQAPADLQANEVAFNFGVNDLANQGDMAVWESISPGADGVFQIVNTRYAGAVPAPGSTTLNNPNYGYAISGIQLEEIPGTPVEIMITAGPTPSSLTIEQGQTAQFQITVSGTSPRYQWYRDDGQPIQNAVSTNTSVLVLTNAQPTDTAVYRVRITNSISDVTSGPASLTVNPDETPPSLVAALGLVNGTNVLINFSERLDTTAPLNAAAFGVQLTAGGGALTIVSAVVANGTNILLTTSLRETNVNYSLSIDANAFADANGNSFAGANIPLPVELMLLAFDGTPWKYEISGNDLGDEWRTDHGFDDSTWSNGISVFDVKRAPRTTIAGFTVRTFLVLTNATSPSGTNNIPTVYFRTHFNLPTDPEQVARLRLRTLVDDADVTYLNYGPELRRSTRYTNEVDRFEYCTGNASDAVIEGPFTLPPSSLVPGDNLIVASLHQDGETSSDLTFAYELIAVVNRFEMRPRLTITYDGTNVHIAWTNPADQLYSATSADAPAGSWTLVGGGGSATVAAGGPARFFTLRQ